MLLEQGIIQGFYPELRSLGTFRPRVLATLILSQSLPIFSRGVVESSKQPGQTLTLDSIAKTLLHKGFTFLDSRPIVPLEVNQDEKTRHSALTLLGCYQRKGDAFLQEKHHPNNLLNF